MRPLANDLMRRGAAILAAIGLVGAALLVVGGASSAPAGVYPPDASWTDAKLPDAKPPVFDTGDEAGNDAGTKDAKPDAPDAETAPPIPPDPTPLVCDNAFVLHVQWNKGVLSIEGARREKQTKKGALPHHMGRFAVELYVGPTLLDRDRFDIPLIGDDGPTSEAFGKGLVTTIDVRVPESDRPTRMEIWDRATDKRWIFSYPPKLSPF
jgi:hypothetical protein